MSTNTLASALFPKTRIEILKELVLSDGKPLHLRELARRTGLDPSGISRELKNLTGVGLVIESRSGNQKLYILNKRSPIYSEIKMTILKTAGLADEITSALDGLSDRIDKAFIYGSFASGTYNNSSDIDLMIVGSVSLREVTGAVMKVSRKLCREVNPVVISSMEYEKKLKDSSSFVSRITSGSVINIKGDTDES